MRRPADLYTRFRSIIDAPAFWDNGRILRVWQTAAPMGHVVIAGAVLLAVACLTGAVVTVNHAERAIASWRLAAAAIDVPLPTIVRRPPDAARLNALKNALEQAYPGLGLKVIGSEMQIFVAGPERLGMWRAAAQRLQVLDPEIRWEVSSLCASSGKDCPQPLYLSVIGSVVDFEMDRQIVSSSSTTTKRKGQ